MATIQTSIQLYDGMSSTLYSINESLNKVINSFGVMQSVSSNSVNASNIKQARDEIEKAKNSLNEMGNNIKRASENQKNFNRNIQDGANAASNLKSKFKRVATVIGSLIGIKKVLDLSDTMTQTTARLNMMNDGLRTTDELQKMIFHSAQRSRGAYLDTLDTVAKMGTLAKDAFKSNEETVAFVEQLNKQFAIAGTNQEAVKGAILQMTQAMGSGVLRGQELNSVFNAAPNIIQTIANYLDVPIGKIRELAQKGQISAQVVKNALLSAAKETNETFEKMPKTIGQVWQSIKNQALMSFMPIFNKIKEIVNSDKFNVFVSNAINAISIIASIAVQAFNVLLSVANFLYDNWSWISPIIWGVVSALVAYKTVVMAANAVTVISTLITKQKEAAEMMAAGATFAHTVQQHGLNAALLACPLVWIIISLIALIAIIFSLCGGIAKLTGVASTGFGVIAGAINVVISFFCNLYFMAIKIFAGIGSAALALGSNICTAFKNSILNVQGFFYGLLSTALSVIEKICEALNKLPFIEFDYSGISSKASEYAAKSAQAYESKGEYKDIFDAFSKGFDSHEAFNKGWASDAFKKGASWGDGVVNKVKSIFNREDMGNGNIPFNFDNSLDDIKKNTNKSAKNTAKMADKMGSLEDSLEYMRDIAEREVINRFTTAQINIEQTNNNTISSDMDIDGVMAKWNSDFSEILDVAAEGAHI